MLYETGCSAEVLFQCDAVFAMLGIDVSQWAELIDIRRLISRLFDSCSIAAICLAHSSVLSALNFYSR